MINSCGVILAGGRSRRMGFDKTGIRLTDETLLARAVRKMCDLFPEVLIVGRPTAAEYGLNALPSKVRLIEDIFRGHGPLGGIHAALSRAEADLLFVTACDMPFWERQLASLLISACQGFDAAVPRIGSYTEPLLACYSHACLPVIEAKLEQDENKVRGIFDAINIRYVPEAELNSVCDPIQAAFNINCVSDLIAGRTILENLIQAANGVPPLPDKPNDRGTGIWLNQINNNHT